MSSSKFTNAGLTVDHLAPGNGHSPVVSVVSVENGNGYRPPSKIASSNGHSIKNGHNNGHSHHNQESNEVPLSLRGNIVNP